MARHALKLPPSPFDSPRELKKRGADARAAARMAFTYLADLLGDVVEVDRIDSYGPSTVYLEAAARASASLQAELNKVDSYIAAATAEAARLDQLTADCRRRAQNGGT